MDWEFLNKMCFCQLVQTWLLKSTTDGTRSVRILYEAYRCQKATIPNSLPEAVKEFIGWQLYDDEKPEWVLIPLGGGIGHD